MALWPFARRRAKLQGAQSIVSAPPAKNGSQPTTPPPSRPIPRKLSKRSSARRRPPNLPGDFIERDFGASLSPIPPSSPMDISSFERRRSDSAGSREDITALPNRTEFGIPPSRPPPSLPTQDLSEKRPDTAESEEDITALPYSKELRTSPHLRPATQDTADIPYNWHLQSASHQSLPAAKERGKLRRNPSRNKRAAHDSPLAKRIPTKKRKDEHLREEEIRAMSAPIPIPRRSAHDSSLLRKDSKKMRDGLNAKLERPMSNISLPLEESIHSSMSNHSDTRNYRLSVIDIVAPRPTIRYTIGNPYSIYAQPTNRRESRTESRARRTPAGRDALGKARIDSLADDLDSAELRELMERDKRRKDEKRKKDIDKVRRKLQKRSEKQQAKMRDQEKEAAVYLPTSGPRTTDRGKGKEKSKGSGKSREGKSKESSRPKETQGLGIATSSQEPALVPVSAPIPAPEAEPLPKPQPAHEEPDATTGADPLSTADPMEGIEETGSATPVPELITPNFPRDEIPRMPLLSSHDEEDEQHMETPFEEIEEDDVAIARHISFPQGTLSPETSPLYPGDRTKASKVLGEDVARGDYSKVSKVLGENVRQSQNLPQLDTRRDSQQRTEKKRSGMWSAIFRRDRKSSAEQGRESPSEGSFSNTSRESMSRHMPPQHLYQPSSNSRSIPGAPTRTMSKFREDLPELPISPPDSRVQSPEATSTGAQAIATRRGFTAPSNITTDINSRRMSSPYENITSRGHTDSPASGGRLSNLMSRSLASVDSEASWLSGKPHRTSSMARKHNSTGTASATRGADDFSTSYEELGIPDDEYFRRLNPQHGEVKHSSGLSAAMRISHKASSSAIAAGSGGSDTDDELRSSPPHAKVDGETIVHTIAMRHPTVVHRDSRVRSSEGLLNQFLDQDPAAEGAYITPQESPTKDKHPTSSSVNTPPSHAKSVNLGKDHARQISAGSATLLDIPKRGSPAQASAAPATPTSPMPETAADEEAYL